jgi:hypothetical protein
MLLVFQRVIVGTDRQLYQFAEETLLSSTQGQTRRKAGTQSLRSQS